jgi:hypothetical protein
MVTNGQLFASMGYELDGTTNQDPILGLSSSTRISIPLPN